MCSPRTKSTVPSFDQSNIFISTKRDEEFYMIKLFFGLLIFAASSSAFAGGLQCQINGTCQCQRAGACDKDGNPIQLPAPRNANERSQAFSSLTCNSGLTNLHLDLRNQAASIAVFCHILGCSGSGTIKSYRRSHFNDIFLLEMNMEHSSGLLYLVVEVGPDGNGVVLNHPRASALSNCIRN